MRILRHFGTLNFLAIIVFAFLLHSCRKVDVGFGSDFLDDNHTQIVKSNIYAPELSTVSIDSFVTSSTGVAMLGAYTDPQFGKISAQSYFEIVPPSLSTPPANKAALDSIVVIITPNKTFYGDTSKPLTLSVFQLTENVVPNPNLGVFFNNDSIPLNSISLGQATTVVRPLKGDSISIRLPDALGDTLLQMLKRNDEIVTNSEKFINYFKGLSIVTDPSGSLMVGCSDAIKMRLYYREPDITINKKTADFNSSSTAHHQFNRINIDRTGTPLGNVNFGTSNSTKVISSTQTNHAAYVQYSTGSMAKITFPTIRSLLQVPNFIKLMQAKLIIRPVKSSYTYPFTLPPTMRLSMTNVNNMPGGDITISVSGGASVTQTGNLNVDPLNPGNKFYTYDITNYVNQVLLSSSGANAGLEGLGLLFLRLPNDHINTFDRVVISDNTPLNNQLELQVHYLTVE